MRFLCGIPNVNYRLHHSLPGGMNSISFFQFNSYEHCTKKKPFLLLCSQNAFSFDTKKLMKSYWRESCKECSYLKNLHSITVAWRGLCGILFVRQFDYFFVRSQVTQLWGTTRREMVAEVGVSLSFSSLHIFTLPTGIIGIPHNSQFFSYIPSVVRSGLTSITNVPQFFFLPSFTSHD